MAATNRDLAAEAERGTFRRDLFYRLNAVTIRIPPLRDRGGDRPVAGVLSSLHGRGCSLFHSLNRS